MLFNSWQFLLFFPVIFFLYQVCISGVTSSQLLLLAASLFFYACWNPSYLVLMLISIIITWYSGILMEKYRKRKKTILFLSLVINLAILFFFKYFNFFADLGNRTAPLFSMPAFIPNFNVLLPVGISFYTFQALGYSIDVYRGMVKAERNFCVYALFVTFFPQLVAGPIERTANLLPQFKSDHHFDYERVVSGLKLAAWGLFKKVMIADRLAVYVNGIYGNIGDSNGLQLALATFYFSVQILCDFSGYSDIAIGIAKVLGFNLMQNFRRPYFSKSISEFWRRWHISLSSWFRDYVYIPLGGNRVSTVRRNCNLIITFVISGLWHGAALHFVVWGFLHSAYQVTENITKKARTVIRVQLKLESSDGRIKRSWQYVQIFITFVLVCFAWVFFRANGLGDALLVYKRFFFIPQELYTLLFCDIPSLGIIEAIRMYFLSPATGLGLRRQILNFLLIVLLFGASYYTRDKSGIDVMRSLPFAVRWIGYAALFYASVGYVVWKACFNMPVSEFVYFQF